MNYDIDAEGNGIATFSFFSKTNTDFTDLSGDSNRRDEFFKIVESYGTNGIPASGKLYENYIPIKIIGGGNTIRLFYCPSNDVGSGMLDLTGFLEYLNDEVIQIY